MNNCQIPVNFCTSDSVEAFKPVVSKKEVFDSEDKGSEPASNGEVMKPDSDDEGSEPVSNSEVLKPDSDDEGLEPVSNSEAMKPDSDDEAFETDSDDEALETDSEGKESFFSAGPEPGNQRRDSKKANRFWWISSLGELKLEQSSRILDQNSQDF